MILTISDISLVQIILLNILNNIVWHQILDTVSSPDRSSDLGGAHIVGDPLCHYVNIILILCQQVGVVNELLWVRSFPKR